MKFTIKVTSNHLIPEEAEASADEYIIFAANLDEALLKLESALSEEYGCSREDYTAVLLREKAV